MNGHNSLAETRAEREVASEAYAKACARQDGTITGHWTRFRDATVAQLKAEIEAK